MSWLAADATPPLLRFRPRFAITTLLHFQLHLRIYLVLSLYILSFT
jgi:hypothetical protein